jgi:uncharacterized protein
MYQKYFPPYKQNDGFEFYGAWLFSDQGKHLLLSPAEGTMILLRDDVFREFSEKRCSGDLKFKLVQRAFAGFGTSRKVSRASENVAPKFFIIDLTQACVLRCVYCFRKIENQLQTISPKILDDICCFIIDYCKKYRKQKIDVQPWGGEPLLAFEQAKMIQDKFHGAGINASISIQNCGVLLSEKIVREAKERKIKIGVSIDGVPELHNIHRPLTSGQGSFEKMRAGVKILHENGYLNNHTTITVISKHSLPYTEQIVRFFCRDLKLHQFKCNIVKKNPMMKQAGLELSVEEVRNFAQRMIAELIELHRHGYKTTEVNISTKILNLLRRKCGNICISRGCMGGRKMVAFAQEGNIFSCDMTDLKNETFGSIYDGKDLMEMLNDAVGSHPFFNKKYSSGCSVCPWHFFCRGGCTSAIRYQSGCYTGGIDEMECTYNSVVYPKIIELLLNEPEMLQELVQDELSFFDQQV